MPADKFGYLLDDKNNKKNISDLAALGLDENYFDTNDSESFRKHLNALYLESHPDKNPDNDGRATEAFKHISEAAGRIKENLDKNHGKYVKNWVYGQGVMVFDFNMEFGEYVNHLANRVNDEVVLLQHLKLKAKELAKNPAIDLTPLPQTAELVKIPQKKDLITGHHAGLFDEISEFSTVPQFIAAFKKIYHFSFVSSDLLEAYSEAFQEIENLAKTRNDFYLIALLQRSNGELGVPYGQNLLKAAELGHILAVRQVAGYALLGSYAPVEQSIRWSLDALYTLQKEVIPSLTESLYPDDQVTLSELMEVWPRTLERIGLKEGEDIPLKGTVGYEQIVLKFITKFAKASAGVQFSLQESAVELFKKNRTVYFSELLSQPSISKPAVKQPEPVVKPVRHAFLEVPGAVRKPVPDARPVGQPSVQKAALTITPINWNKQGTEYLLNTLQAIGNKPDLNLAQKKKQAKDAVMEILPKITSNKELLKLSALILHKNSPDYAYLREEQAFWRLNKLGNTNTWNNILGALKTQMDDNVEKPSKEKYTKAEYAQFMTIMNEHRGRGFGPVTHSKLYKQLNEIPEGEKEITITKNV